VKVLLSRPVIKGEFSLSSFPQPLTAEEIVSLAEQNTEYKTVVLGINCTPIFLLNRTRVATAVEDSIASFTWPMENHVSLRLLEKAENGFIVKSACPVCQKPITSVELFVDPVFFRLLTKYPDESGCIIKKDGSDSLLSASDEHFLPVIGLRNHLFKQKEIIAFRQSIV
jgi:hypothetical protein